MVRIHLPPPTSLPGGTPRASPKRMDIGLRVVVADRLVVRSLLNPSLDFGWPRFSPGKPAARANAQLVVEPVEEALGPQTERSGRRRFGPAA